MFYDNAKRILIGFIACVVVAALCFGGIKLWESSEVYAAEAARQEICSGEIVDKQIVNAKQTLFTSSEMDYQIAILFAYEHDGETKTATKWISVERDIYTKAEPGHWFDGKTLTVNPPESEET